MPHREGVSKEVAALSDIDGKWSRSYGEDIIIALLVNPHSLHVYWEVSNATRMQVEMHNHCEWKHVPKLLRLYDVTQVWFDGSNAPLYREIAIDDCSDNRYLDSLPPGRDWVVDLGFQTTRHSWVSLNRSNPVRCPSLPTDDCRPISKFLPPAVYPVVRPPSWASEFTGYSIQMDVQAVWE